MALDVIKVDRGVLLDCGNGSSDAILGLDIGELAQQVVNRNLMALLCLQVILELLIGVFGFSEQL